VADIKVVRPMLSLLLGGWTDRSTKTITILFQMLNLPLPDVFFIWCTLLHGES
jgi:hypothetical protein